MDLRDLADELESLLPELRYSRETHIYWCDCDQSYRDANPDIGSKEFHANAIKDYDRRIRVIVKAVNELRAALHEHPLQRRWLKQSKITDNVSYAAGLKDCAADLDTYEDRARGLLEEALTLVCFLSTAGETMCQRREALRATNPDYVLVPQSALDWLFGAGPAADGRDFSDDEPPDKKPAYWWRSEFRRKIAAAQDDVSE